MQGKILYCLENSKEHGRHEVDTAVQSAMGKIKKIKQVGFLLFMSCWVLLLCILSGKSLVPEWLGETKVLNQLILLVLLYLMKSTSPNRCLDSSLMCGGETAVSMSIKTVCEVN